MLTATMMRQQRDNLIPLAIIVICGGMALGFVIYRLGWLSFAQWFLYPSLFFFSFALVRIFNPAVGKFDCMIWKTCKWWSAVWLIWFSLGLCAIPLSLGLWLPLASIITNGVVNPFLALILHFFIWACASDILKTLKDPDPQILDTSDH